MNPKNPDRSRSAMYTMAVHWCDLNTQRYRLCESLLHVLGELVRWSAFQPPTDTVWRILTRSAKVDENLLRGVSSWFCCGYQSLPETSQTRIVQKRLFCGSTCVWIFFLSSLPFVIYCTMKSWHLKGDTILWGDVWLSSSFWVISMSSHLKQINTIDISI